MNQQRIFYPTDDTDSNTIASLSCSICLEIFTQPVEFIPCKHLACIDCAKALTWCPECRSAIESRAEPNRIIAQLAAEIKMRCADCDAVLPNRLVNTHECSKDDLEKKKRQKNDGVSSNNNNSAGAAPAAASSAAIPPALDCVSNAQLAPPPPQPMTEQQVLMMQLLIAQKEQVQQQMQAEATRNERRDHRERFRRRHENNDDNTLQQRLGEQRGERGGRHRRNDHHERGQQEEERNRNRPRRERVHNQAQQQVDDEQHRRPPRHARGEAIEQYVRDHHHRRDFNDFGSRRGGRHGGSRNNNDDDETQTVTTLNNNNDTSTATATATDGPIRPYRPGRDNNNRAPRPKLTAEEYAARRAAQAQVRQLRINGKAQQQETVDLLRALGVRVQELRAALRRNRDNKQAAEELGQLTRQTAHLRANFANIRTALNAQVKHIRDAAGLSSRGGGSDTQSIRTTTTINNVAANGNNDDDDNALARSSSDSLSNGEGA